MAKKGYRPEQIITEFREAEIPLSQGATIKVKGTDFKVSQISMPESCHSSCLNKKHIPIDSLFIALFNPDLLN